MTLTVPRMHRDTVSEGVGYAQAIADCQDCDKGAAGVASSAYQWSRDHVHHTGHTVQVQVEQWHTFAARR